ncbi:MAG TPA: stage II sporulation protein M [Steroidobacteraceae bacterium]|nr:stage II sporulation protein M [Steroidobacteraceae bacterium]
MTPLQFEQSYQAEWDELAAQLRLILEGRKNQSGSFEPIRGERVAALYRRACEHLALARARAYPRYLIDKLDRITAEAHQVIYHQRDFGAQRLLHAILYDFPRAVRAHAGYVWLSAVLLYVPMFLIGWLVYERPDLILSVVDSDTVANMEMSYSDAAEALGSTRGPHENWYMFGFYILNNIGISFQCFAGGLVAGIGSIVALLINGAAIGAVAGYLTERGYSTNFYSFVVTHGAFELTAIVLSGATGLRIGHALIAPGRNTRLQSLVTACRECMPIIYGFVIMLVIAAAIEAFWSSARWLPLPLKYTVAALCWLAVMLYLTLQGRRAR